MEKNKLENEINRRIGIIKKLPDGFGREILYSGTSALIFQKIKNPKKEKLLTELEDVYLRRKLKKVI